MTDELLGFQLPRNERQIRACLNLGGTTITPGMAVMWDAANPFSASQTGICVIPTTAGAYAYGVALDTAATGQQLRVQVSGLVGVFNSAAGAIAAGAIVDADTGGQVKSFVAATPQLGQALNSAVSQGDPVLIEIRIAKNA